MASAPTHLPYRAFHEMLREFQVGLETILTVPNPTSTALKAACVA